MPVPPRPPVTTITEPIPHPEGIPCIECGEPATHARHTMIQLGLIMTPLVIGWCRLHAPVQAKPSNGVCVVEGRRIGEVKVRGHG